MSSVTDRILGGCGLLRAIPGISSSSTKLSISLMIIDESHALWRKNFGARSRDCPSHVLEDGRLVLVSFFSGVKRYLDLSLVSCEF